jgi:hypothetical protein
MNQLVSHDIRNIKNVSFKYSTADISNINLTSTENATCHYNIDLATCMPGAKIIRVFIYIYMVGEFICHIFANVIKSSSKKLCQCVSWQIIWLLPILFVYKS